MPDIDQPGSFYLGRPHDLATGETQNKPLLYDNNDLTTHAVCVGMTGSGKTGLCVTLLEEAALDGIPAIAIDPKGDLGNLLLAFPKLRPSDFRPWVDTGEASRNQVSPDDYAASQAELWRKGLAKWGQEPDRIQRYCDAVDRVIYTPGSSAGIPITVLKSFRAPTAELAADDDAFNERVGSATSGLLALLGIDADPVRSREHIFLSKLFDAAWRSGRDLDLQQLIENIQRPPFDRVGVVDLESFFPAADRYKLAMSLNNLIASPSFASWMQGEPLDVQRMLFSPSGKPRLAVVSIAHLDEPQRMFFVTLLLNEVLSWVRTQPGTSSLRALLYMDEVFGYFPPLANPPSKRPMLTLLKQARAYGLGCILTTQNPVDLDYKGLSNAGTWFLGRLQTERDKARVIEGLEGASAEAGSKFNRQQMEATLAGLAKRVFLMNNVHDNAPVVFQTRWAMSYLCGPLTRGQIKTLMDPVRGNFQSLSSTSSASNVGEDGELSRAGAAATLPPATAPKTRPILPAGIPEGFATARQHLRDDGRLEYLPAVAGNSKVHFVQAASGIDHWMDVSLLKPADESAAHDFWANSTTLPERLAIDSQPEVGEALPSCRSNSPARKATRNSAAIWLSTSIACAYSNFGTASCWISRRTRVNPRAHFAADSNRQFPLDVRPSGKKLSSSFPRSCLGWRIESKRPRPKRTRRNGNSGRARATAFGYSSMVYCGSKALAVAAGGGLQLPRCEAWLPSAGNNFPRKRVSKSSLLNIRTWSRSATNRY